MQHTDFEIKEFEPGQETMVYQLVKKVYDQFVAPDYSEKGNMFFYDWIAPDKIAARRLSRNMWLAFSRSQLVGVVETRDNQYISLLFVDSNYQKKGIARALMHISVQHLTPASGKILVHASPFSIPVYEKLGFHANGVLQEKNGIKYLPMELDREQFLKSQNIFSNKKQP